MSQMDKYPIMHLAQYYQDTWSPHAGKTVSLDGLPCRLRVEVWTQKYPYTAEVIRVTADPLSKRTTRYLEVKAKLGDDWGTDVLASSIELQAAILSQCGVA